MLPLMIVVHALLQQAHARRLPREPRNQVGEINAQVEDSLLGIRVVKSFANEAIEDGKVSSRATRSFCASSARRYLLSWPAFNTTNRVFDGLMYIVVVVAGALFIIQGSHHRVGFDGLSALCQHPADLHPPDCGVHRAVPAGHDRHRALLRNHGRDARISRTRPTPWTWARCAATSTFDHVSFHYSDDDKDVLSRHQPHTSTPANSVALVGPCGRRQDHAVQPDSPLLRRERRAAFSSTGKDITGSDPASACATQHRHGAAGGIPVLRHASMTILSTASPGASREEVDRGRRAGRGPRLHHPACPRDMTPSWASGASSSPAGRSSAFPSPGCS